MATILIVEDYESLQRIYRTVFEQEGYTVEVVNDGFLALDRAKAGAYDAILLDLLLPHMSGMEFLEAFKPKDHLGTKVVVCSNFASPKYVDRATALGAARVLTKSNLTPREVAAVVTQALKVA